MDPSNARPMPSKVSQRKLNITLERKPLNNTFKKSPNIQTQKSYTYESDPDEYDDMSEMADLGFR